MPYETPSYVPVSEEELAKYAREEDKRKLRAKLARPKPDPEGALAAVKELDKKQLEALRQQLAGIKMPSAFPEGTGEIPLSENDLEEVEDLTGKVQEIK